MEKLTEQNEQLCIRWKIGRNILGRHAGQSQNSPNMPQNQYGRPHAGLLDVQCRKIV